MIEDLQEKALEYSYQRAHRNETQKDWVALLDSKEVIAAHVAKLEDALTDAVSGLRCIQQQKGDLYGIGFDRVEQKASELLPDYKPPITKES